MDKRGWPKAAAVARWVSRAALLSALAACMVLPAERKPSVYETEKFQGDETFSRLIDADATRACEAARRK